MTFVKPKPPPAYVPGDVAMTGPRRLINDACRQASLDGHSLSCVAEALAYHLKWAMMAIEIVGPDATIDDETVPRGKNHIFGEPQMDRSQYPKVSEDTGGHTLSDRNI